MSRSGDPLPQPCGPPRSRASSAASRPQGRVPGGPLSLDVRVDAVPRADHSDVRDYAAEHGVDVEAAIPEGMREQSRQVEALGGEIYHESLPDEA